MQIPTVNNTKLHPRQQNNATATPHHFTLLAAELCRCAAVGLTQRENQIELECYLKFVLLDHTAAFRDAFMRIH